VPSPTHPLFHHFCRPKISQAQNGFPRLTRPVFRRRLPVQHVAWTALTTNTDGLPPSCSPLPYCSTSIGHTTFLHNLLSSLCYGLRCATVFIVLRSQGGSVWAGQQSYTFAGATPLPTLAPSTPPPSLARGSPVHMDPQRRLSVLICHFDKGRHQAPAILQRLSFSSDCHSSDYHSPATIILQRLLFSSDYHSPATILQLLCALSFSRRKVLAPERLWHQKSADTRKGSGTRKVLAPERLCHTLGSTTHLLVLHICWCYHIC
jgi:hypothetical protein